MASKEPKNIKRFPKRLLSSFRRGKKVNLPTGKDELHIDSDERAGFTSYDLENAQNENATIDFEATLVLNTPKKRNNSGRGNVDALVTPKRNLRHVLAEDSNDVVDHFSTPRVERLVLGGPMSASADSGIDCSILLSEKNSPEQFVAFTRREAERLKQEQLHNSSVLETLNETDRSSSEDCDSDNVTDGAKNVINVESESNDYNDQLLGAVGGISVNKTTDQVCEESDNVCDALPQPDHADETLELENTEQSSPVSLCDNVGSTCGDYVFLTENHNSTASPLIDVTSIISKNRDHGLEGFQSGDSNTNLNQSRFNRVENEPALSTDIANNQTIGPNGSINIDSCYLHYYANRTDEIKSAEATRLRQENSAAETLHLAVTHDIVNPVPVVTSSIATHRVLQSTPSPARLYVNENSAFAKCKSLKRSVSDVGKGILGRFRHRSKDGRAPKDESGSVDDSALDTLGKKSGLTKLKKFGARKEKKNAKVRHSSEQFATSKVETDSANYTEIRKNKKPVKSPVTKEICSIGEKVMNETSGKTKQSPVYKEILSENVKQELQASFKKRRSPVMMESIQDLTSGISQMTSALCASSAESIACICDCKNRFSDPECCDKRRTPSPLGSVACTEQRKSPVGVEYFEIAHSESIDCASETPVSGDIEDGVCDTYATSTIENEITEYSPHSDGNKSHKNDSKALMEPNYLFCDEKYETSDESSDEIYDNYYSDDNDNNSSDECSDLDCSNCCNASPNTGNNDFLSSSSDSECSIMDSCENLSISDRGVKHNEMGQSGSPCQSSRSSSVTSRSAAQNSESLSCSSSSSGKSTPAEDDSSFSMENNSFSVSFKEIDFENGDVMYVENDVGDEFGDGWMNSSEDSVKLSTVCATPASSPRLCDDGSLENSPNPVNPFINNVSNSSQNANSPNCFAVYEEGPVPSPLSFPNCTAESGTQNSVRSPRSALSPPISAETSPTPLNLSQDSTFTNVSFEGSFADASFSVHSQSARHRNEMRSGNSLLPSRESSFFDEQSTQNGTHSGHPDLSLLNYSSLSQSSSQNVLNNSRYKAKSIRRRYNLSLGTLNDSRLLQSTLRRNHNNSVGGLNDSSILNNSRLNTNNSTGNLDYRKRFEKKYFRHSLNTSSSSVINESLDRFETSWASFHETSPMSSPLDLSINKGRSTNCNRPVTSKSDKTWVDRHVGQVYSPAKRVLHKNSGLSESDLCKQILDLYVSDADESGFDLVDNDDTLDASSCHSTSFNDSSVLEKHEGFQSTNLDDSGSEDDQPGLQFGTYVAPRNVVKETNVDDFTTTTVWTCYTGEAKTRKLQGNPESAHLRGEDRHRAALNELRNISSEKTSTKKKRSADIGTSLGKTVRGHEREALRDQTNTAHRLSALEMPVPSLAKDIQAESVEQEIRENTQRKTKMNEKSFDHLTMLHTAHNGQRKVRCLTMDESQSVVKYYPPPKEASRISWGQTISELDLYRHTPRKTPVKTRPILNQKENTYPYEDDSPSPIVLTKMRKPKSLAKRYKNWPWS